MALTLRSILIVLLAAVALPGCSTWSGVKQDTQAAKDYTYEKKDEYRSRLEYQMQELDAKTEELIALSLVERIELPERAASMAVIEHEHHDIVGRERRSLARRLCIILLRVVILRRATRLLVGLCGRWGRGIKGGISRRSKMNPAPSPRERAAVRAEGRSPEVRAE